MADPPLFGLTKNSNGVTNNEWEDFAHQSIAISHGQRPISFIGQILFEHPIPTLSLSVVNTDRLANNRVLRASIVVTALCFDRESRASQNAAFQPGQVLEGTGNIRQHARQGIIRFHDADGRAAGRPAVVTRG